MGNSPEINTSEGSAGMAEVSDDLKSSDKAHSLHVHLRRWARLLVVLISLLMMVYWLPQVARYFLTRQPVAMARRDAVAKLSKITSRDTLLLPNHALSAWFLIPDGSWIAIDYADTHGYPNWSLSIARCSDGTWYQSEHHFCGAYSAFNERRRWILADPKAPDLIDLLASQRRSALGVFVGVEQSGDLAAAKRALESVGFTRFEARSQ